MIVPASRTARYFIVLGFIVLVMVLLQLRGMTGWFVRAGLLLPRPITGPVQAAAGLVRRSVSGLVSIRQIYVENAELQSRVRTLEQQAAQLSSLQSENDSLKASMGFAARPPVAIVPCTVIGRDPGGITQTLLLSCGSNQGVASGQGVVSAGYLVGKVVLTTSSTATVRLLTATTTVVDARITNRRISGVLRGSFGSGLLLDYVSETAEVAKGDLVTTAGINDAIPPDVLIGSISEIVKQQGALFYQITVASPVDLRDLRYVHVLKP